MRLECPKVMYVLALAAALAAAPPAAGQCPVGTWFGTAPVCKATEKDCTSANLNYWMSNSYGMGSICTQGLKVLCVSEPRSSYGDLEWLGSAPFCDAKPIDCTKKGKVFITYGSAGDGARCTSGMKVLCASRKAADGEAAAAPGGAEAVTAFGVHVFGSQITNTTNVKIIVTRKTGPDIAIGPGAMVGPYTIEVRALKTGTAIYLPARNLSMGREVAITISNLTHDSVTLAGGGSTIVLNRKQKQ
jgi:hypothetical protein